MEFPRIAIADGRALLVHGDVLDTLRSFEPGIADVVVTDPPYGLGFMGKKWDRRVPPVEVWAECYRLLPDGGRLLAFGGTRTAHRMWCAIEDAGFVLEDSVEFFLGAGDLAVDLWETLNDDQRKALGHVLDALLGTGDLAWLYGSGFPKHRSKLKPGFEPICVARKGFVSSLNIDACRIPIGAGDEWDVPQADFSRVNPARPGDANGSPTSERHPDGLRAVPHAGGRWPANVAHDGSDEVLEAFSHAGYRDRGSQPAHRVGIGFGSGARGTQGATGAKMDGGSADRFFFSAKASRGERNLGLGGSPEPAVSQGARPRDTEHADWQARNGNHHPTVKPVALMRWLCRLVTPPGGTVLDPYCGSGSTGVACAADGFRFVGVDHDPSYLQIAERRLNLAHTQGSLFDFTEDQE